MTSLDNLVGIILCILGTCMYGNCIADTGYWHGQCLGHIEVQ